MNNVTIVGRLVNEPEIKTLDDGSTRAYISIAVPRDYKNSEGVYETDFIRCVLWNSVANATKEYCKKGDILGIKGKLRSTKSSDEKNKKYSLEVNAEKVSFISSKTIKDNDVDFDKKI